MSSRNLTANREQSVALVSGSINAGNGADAHAPIGKTTTHEFPTLTFIFRELIRFNLDWTSVYKIVKATLWLTSDRAVHATTWSGAHPVVQRLSGAFTENGGVEAGWSSSAGTVYPGPGVTGSTVDNGVLANTQDKAFGFDVTAFVEAWAPATVKKRDGSAGDAATNFGLRVKASDESSLGLQWEFYTRRSAVGFAPYIELKYSTNTPPDVPVLVHPATQSDGSPEFADTRFGKRISVQWSKPPALPASSTIVQVRVQIKNDAKSAVLLDRNYAVTGRSGTLNITDAALTRKKVRVRIWIQARNSAGVASWSPATDIDTGRAQTRFTPYAPDGIFLQRTTTDRPIIAANVQSEDSHDKITGLEVIVTKPQVAGASIPMWVPGILAQPGTTKRAQENYAGNAIATTDILSVDMRVYGRSDDANVLGAPGDWRRNIPWTFTSVTGPTAMSPTTRDTKILSLAGPLTIGNDTEYDQLSWYIKRNGVVIYASGLLQVDSTLTTDVTIPAGIVNWGDGSQNELTWGAQIRITGGSSLDPASPDYPIQFDALPATTITAEGRTSLGAVGTTNPIWDSPYNDPDVASYGEAASAKELEIRAAADPPGSGAIVLRRTSVSQIVEDEATGEQLEALTTTTGTSTDANVAVATYSATHPTGYSGNHLEIQFTGGSSTDRGARKTALSGPKDLSVYGGGALIRLWRRITSVTNLVRLVVRYEFATSSDWAEFELVAGGAAVNTWAEVVVAKGNPRATNGTVDWSLYSGVRRFFADVSGAFTGNLQVVDERLGVTRTAKTSPDGDLAFESSYDARARYHDDATPKASTTLAANSLAGATNVKVTAVTLLAAGDELTIETAGLVETRTITTIGTAGSGGTGVTVSEAFTYAHASTNPAKVYYWGPWATIETDKISTPLGVTLVSPTDGATVTDPRVPLVHSITSPGGETQISHTYRIYERGVEDLQIREVTVADDGLTDTPDRFLLDDATVYAWEKDVVSSDGLVTTSARFSFTTDFTPPAAPTSLVATEDADSSSIELAWDASADAFYDHTRIYWRNARGNWVRIDGGPDTLDDGRTALTDTSFTFYGGRQGVNDFRVSFDNGAISDDESDPTLVSVTLDPILGGREGIWSVVTDANDQFTFPMVVVGAPRTRRSGIETFVVPGLGPAVHQNWRPGGRQVSASVRVRPATDGDLVSLLEQLYIAGQPFWFKAPAGYIWDPLRSLIVGLRDVPAGAGWVEIALDLDETSRGSAGTLSILDAGLAISTGLPAHLEDLVWEDDQL